MRKILVVDDEESIREVLTMALEGVGYAVTVARNGKEAARVIKEWAPDLVITDIVMPDKEGLELIQELRHEHPEIHIIAMTGSPAGKEIYLKTASYLGAEHVLVKPFLIDDLMEAVEKVLGDG